MHYRLSQLLEQEVVGEVCRVGDSFFDVAHGRLCLDRLDEGRVRTILALLKREYGEVAIDDRLHLRDPSRPVRGIMEVSIPDPDIGTLYLLQITSHHVLSFFERRFMLEADTFADLMGTVSHGLHAVVMQGENPLRMISGFDQLYERYQQGLDAVVKAAVNGAATEEPEGAASMPLLPDPLEGLRALDSAGVTALMPLLRPVRDAWRLLPWSLRSKLDPVTRLKRDRLVKHDQVLDGTMMFAADVLDGEPNYHYEHMPMPREDYDQVLAWMAELHDQMLSGYRPPRSVAVMGRASSVELFLNCFPGYRPVVGETFKEDG